MNKFGVAFSGGGYRAAIYHIGTLRALHNLKLLDKIDVLCTNSGGSITGSYFCLYKDSKSYEDLESELKTALDKSVLNKIIFHWRALL